MVYLSKGIDVSEKHFGMGITHIPRQIEVLLDRYTDGGLE